MSDSTQSYPTIIQFLKEIGIEINEIELTEDTFLPGIKILSTTIVVDRSKLISPGDLLHEAGHIAVTEASIRSKIGTSQMDENWPTDGDELSAILWFYAALTHLKLDPKIVFHAAGYKNESDWLIEQFTSGNFIGLPLFEWMGFCGGDIVYPNVKMWMRE